ncbi:MAG: hypothetical protein GX982_01905 [Tissierellia bacterium]|nr:hypothetical protein [Tissierellia bacterium]
MNSFTKREQIIILIITAVMIFTLGYKVLNKDDNSQSLVVEGEELDFRDVKETTDKENEEVVQNKNGQDYILIHITGEVKSPGIVKLQEGDRIIDAIEKAGGLTSKADQSSINLAQKLFDEDKVNIPEVGQNIEDPNTSIEVVSQGSGVVESGNSSGSSGSGKININNASKEELKTLPGVGEATSQKIIDYRESSKFTTPEDIMKVSGIGEKKFEAIKEMITVR